MMTTEKFLLQHKKDTQALVDRFKDEYSKFDKQHRAFCIHSLLLAIALAGIAVGSVCLSCFTKLQITGFILLGIDLITACYFVSYIKKKADHFLIEFQAMIERQKETFDVFRLKSNEQFSRISAFEIVKANPETKQLIEILLRKGRNEFEIGQMFLDIRDESSSFEEFHQKLNSLKQTYIKENN